MARQYNVVSGDGHLDLASDHWVPYVPEKWRLRAPRRIMLEDGNEAMVIENRPPLSPTGLIGTVRGGRAVSFHSEGNGPPEQRLREQDMDGVDAEILYTHPMYTRFWRGIREDEGYKAIIHAYNRWLIEEYCACDPQRLIAMAVIPDTGIADAMEELKFAKQAGFKGACLHRFPSGKGYPTAEDDSFWAASIEMNMPLTSHVVGMGSRFTTEGPIMRYPSSPDKGPGEGRDPINIIRRYAGEDAILPLQLIFSGVFDRFPALRFYIAETQIGWVPNCLAQLDDSYEMHKDFIFKTWGLKPLDRPLSAYIRERCLWGFIMDPLGVQLRDLIGIGNIIWGSDFAHGMGRWPQSQKSIDDSMVGVPKEERFKMVAGNAIDYFHLGE